MKKFLHATTPLQEIEIESERAPRALAYRMDLKMIKLLALQLLHALTYLHHQGIIHRNLKPDNVFIEGYERTRLPFVKLSDFALSKYQ
jgi:serine/threonine protein kinase